MGYADEERQRLLHPPDSLAGDEENPPATTIPASGAPGDRFHLAYIVYFTLGMGFLLPWNAFITAVDYFGYLYPSAPVDRVFSLGYMIPCLLFLLILVCWVHLSSAAFRINVGLAMFAVSLVVVPVLDAFYVRGSREVYGAYDLTVGAVVLSGIADAFVQGSVIGSAGELPAIYMQAVSSGTAASGVLVSAMRVISKAIFPQDAAGLRRSANLYFGVTIVIMIICIVCYNAASRLPVVRHYQNIKRQAMKQEGVGKTILSGSAWRSTLWNIVGRMKLYGFGIFLIYVVTLSIFPGYITEDVHSETLKDWYPILLIAGYNVFDLVGKALPAVCPLEDANIAVGGSIARLLFYPLFLGCLHGPHFFRTEIPVAILTCLLGLTNGYFTTILMMLAPKAVPIQHSETAGIVLVLFLVIGLAVGSIVSWFWVI